MPDPGAQRGEGRPETPGKPIGTCLAFDFGSKRIGTAVGTSLLKTAQPLIAVVNNNGTPDWSAIDKLVAEWQPSHLVVGWPLTEDGEEQALTPHVNGFINRLVKRYHLPAHKVDERYTSVAAQAEIRRLRSSGQRRRKTSRADVDTLAAALILESWFNHANE